MGAIADSQEPTKFLTDPQERSNEFLGQPFADPGTVLDWLSVSHIVNELVKSLCGYDFFGEAAMAFSGDWEAVWEAAGTFENLADAMQAIGVNISGGNLDLDTAWDGNAGDAAYIYFMTLASRTSGQQFPLRELAKQYRAAADGTYRLAQVFSGILKDIVDAAIIAAIAASAGTAAIETGIGAVAGYAVAAYELMKIMQLIDRAKKIISTAVTTMNAIVGLINAASADLADFKKQALPAANYDHPAVV